MSGLPTVKWSLLFTAHSFTESCWRCWQSRANYCNSSRCSSTSLAHRVATRHCGKVLPASCNVKVLSQCPSIWAFHWLTLPDVRNWGNWDALLVPVASSRHAQVSTRFCTHCFEVQSDRLLNSLTRAFAPAPERANQNSGPHPKEPMSANWKRSYSRTEKEEMFNETLKSILSIFGIILDHHFGQRDWTTRKKPQNDKVQDQVHKRLRQSCSHVSQVVAKIKYSSLVC